MKTKNIILTVVLAAVILGIWVIVRHYNKFTGSAWQTQGHHGIYYCPMHPWIKNDKPGFCPICGMALVLGHEHKQVPAIGIPGYTTIPVSVQKQQLIGLKTALVGKSNAYKIIRAVGYISTNNDLYKLQDEYVQNYMNFEMVYRDYKRFEHTRRNWETHRELQLKLHEVEDKLLSLGLGKSQIEQLQKYSWETPWDQPDLLFLNDTFDYWVVAQIFEDDLRFVKVGQKADVDIPAYGQKVKGIVRSIGGIIDPQTRTANALIELKGDTGQLKENMFVNVEFPVKSGEAIVVPREAVMDTGLRKIVFIQKDKDEFEPRNIETGLETDDGFEVKSGLKEGERIVVSGNFLLDSESRIQAGLEDTTTAAGGDSHG